jgi:hypothetical protein
LLTLFAESNIDICRFSSHSALTNSFVFAGEKGSGALAP